MAATWIVPHCVERSMRIRLHATTRLVTTFNDSPQRRVCLLFLVIVMLLMRLRWIGTCSELISRELNGKILPLIGCHYLRMKWMRTPKRERKMNWRKINPLAETCFHALLFCIRLYVFGLDFESVEMKSKRARKTLCVCVCAKKARVHSQSLTNNNICSHFQ